MPVPPEHPTATLPSYCSRPKLRHRSCGEPAAQARVLRTLACAAGSRQNVSPLTVSSINAPPCGCRPLPARRLRQDGYDIRTVQELMGHADVSTTMMYTHVLNKGGKGVNSPLDV